MSELTLTSVDVARNGIPILRDCSLVARRGQITVLLGSNGAGKTTLLESISGVLPCNAGTIALEGEELHAASRRRRAHRGLAHVEQGRTVFPGLSVWENVITATDDDAVAERALAAFPELVPARHRHADHLSGGEQQMVVLARALASEPKMLLVDEMSLGLAPKVVHRLLQAIRELADGGLGIVLVEQFARLALEVGDDVYILRRGTIAHHGDCQALLASPEVLHRAYLA